MKCGLKMEGHLRPSWYECRWWQRRWRRNHWTEGIYNIIRVGHSVAEWVEVAYGPNGEIREAGKMGGMYAMAGTVMKRLAGRLRCGGQ